MAGLQQCDRSKANDLIRAHFHAARQKIEAQNPSLHATAKDTARRRVLKKMGVAVLLERQKRLLAARQRLTASIEQTNEAIEKQVLPFGKEGSARRRYGAKSVEEIIDDQVEATVPAIVGATTAGKSLEKIDKTERELLGVVLAATKREQLDAVLKKLK